MTRTDFFTGIGIMVFSAVIYVIALNMPRVSTGLGPGDYPRFIAAGLFVLGGILAVKSYLAGLTDSKKIYEKSGVIRVSILVVLTFGYIQSMGYLGFVWATIPYLIATMYLFGARRPVLMVTVSVGCAAGIYLIFRYLFQVMLPTFSWF